MHLATNGYKRFPNSFVADGITSIKSTILNLKYCGLIILWSREFGCQTFDWANPYQIAEINYFVIKLAFKLKSGWNWEHF